jgi:beta-glucanase (GH16 family)
MGRKILLFFWFLLISNFTIAQGLFEERPSFEDEFSGKVINEDKWLVEVKDEKVVNLYYKRENQRIKNGKLVFTFKKEDYKGRNYTSGSIITKKKFGYGKWEIRAKTSAAKELWPAMWLRASDGKMKLKGEFDILEHWPSQSSKEYQANYHIWGTIKGRKETHLQYPKNVKGFDITKWHTYTVLNTPECLIMEVDGIKVAEWTPKDVADWAQAQPYDLVISLACSNWAANNTDQSSSKHQKMYIDWVRFYKMK